MLKGLSHRLTCLVGGSVGVFLVSCLVVIVFVVFFGGCFIVGYFSRGGVLVHCSNNHASLQG